jgi:hypothetical protein
MKATDISHYRPAPPNTFPTVWGTVWAAPFGA